MSLSTLQTYPDSNVPVANMGPIWGRQDPGGPHVGPNKFAIWVATFKYVPIKWWFAATKRDSRYATTNQKTLLTTAIILSLTIFPHKYQN